MTDLALFVQLTVDGIALGCIVALAAVGLTLTSGILRFSNFAHGDLMTFGAYVALLANVSWRWPIFGAIALGMVATLGLTCGLDKLLWERLRRRRATPTTATIVSIGVALVLRNAIVLIWGASPTRFNLPTFAALNFGGINITRNRLLTVVITAAVVGALYYLLQHTKMGRAMRAVADNPELARVTGIDVNRVVLWVWAIAGGATALGGCLYGAITNLRPNMGWSLILPMFAAIIAGGIGSPFGAIAGALLVGIAQEVSTFCPAGLGEMARFCLGTNYKIGVGLVAIVLVLLVRPQGLFRGML
ncbi:MAG TPA: branched-chain amino acid ABC transporter permease [Cyanobacteria bacterium UBA8156]|nr:branched-chain amino acid ABC transporter permease [Cyanobacteria bacterium UBA8156]